MDKIIRGLEEIMGNLGKEIVNSEEWKKMENEFNYTWGDRLVDVVYYPFYYVGYFFLWLAYWIWKAFKDAHEEVWG